MSAKALDRLEFERALWAGGVTRVAGVDEAWRDPLAGPVAAAAVVFPSRWARGSFDDRLRGLNDSKQLTEAQREEFFALLTTLPRFPAPLRWWTRRRLIGSTSCRRRTAP